MTTHKIFLWISIQALVAGLVIAETVEPGAMAARPAPSRLEPWMSKRLPARLSRKLTDSFPLAVDRVREQPTCQALFEEMGADGLEALAKSLYYVATIREEQGPCRTATAFTSVGSPVTRLCRSFGKLSDQQAAVVLIHEALHHVGKTERPQDPDGLDSSEINELVSKNCAL